MQQHQTQQNTGYPGYPPYATPFPQNYQQNYQGSGYTPSPYVQQAVQQKKRGFTGFLIISLIFTGISIFMFVFILYNLFVIVNSQGLQKVTSAGPLYSFTWSNPLVLWAMSGFIGFVFLVCHVVQRAIEGK